MRSLGRVLLRCAVSALLLVGTPSVRAQDLSASESAVARQLFVDGVAASHENRWQDAREAFRRAYELSHRPLTLMNLATAERNLGLLVEAAESYRRFLHESTASEERDFREAAQSALEELEPLLPHLVLSVIGLGDDDVVLLGTAPVARAMLQVPIPLDPGTYTVVVQRNGVEVARTNVELAQSESREITLAVSESPLAPARVASATQLAPTNAPAIRDDRAPGTFERPWVWFAIGGGVAVVVITIVLIAAATSSSPSLYDGNLSRVTIHD